MYGDTGLSLSIIWQFVAINKVCRVEWWRAKNVQCSARKQFAFSIFHFSVKWNVPDWPGVPLHSAPVRPHIRIPPFSWEWEWQWATLGQNQELHRWFIALLTLLIFYLFAMKSFSAGRTRGNSRGFPEFLVVVGGEGKGKGLPRRTMIYTDIGGARSQLEEGSCFASPTYLCWALQGIIQNKNYAESRKGRT